VKPDVALARLCSRAKADCSKGVVVGGFSQGAVIATLRLLWDDGATARIGRVAGAVIAGLLMSANGVFVNFLNEHLNIGQYQTIVAGIALALTAIKNPDGVASELASAARGPGRWLGAVRDRVVPVRAGGRPAAVSSAGDVTPDAPQARAESAGRG